MPLSLLGQLTPAALTKIQLSLVLLGTPANQLVVQSIVALLLQLGGWKHEVLALCVVDICIALE
jgi:hypothetical protein